MTPIYCELDTYEQVEVFDNLFERLGEKDKPSYFAQKEPLWSREGRARGEGDDPLAVVIIRKGKTHFLLYSAYRCYNGTKVDVKHMECLLLFALDYKLKHQQLWLTQNTTIASSSMGMDYNIDDYIKKTEEQLIALKEHKAMLKLKKKK